MKAIMQEYELLKAKLSMVEPVFGTLTQCMGLRKTNTINIKQYSYRDRRYVAFPIPLKTCHL
jgi:hypothetical protein